MPNAVIEINLRFYLLIGFPSAHLVILTVDVSLLAASARTSAFKDCLNILAAILE